MGFEPEEEEIEGVECTYVQGIFVDESPVNDNGDTAYSVLLSGLTSKAASLVADFSNSEDAPTFKDGVESGDTSFLYTRFQGSITRELRYLTIQELYDAIEESDAYGTQSEINVTSISGILADPQIGFFTVQQLLSAPHVTERVNILTGLLEYVGVGLRHRITTLSLIAHSAGVNILDDSWLNQELQCLVSSSVNAEGVEDTLLSGALVLADNASRKAYAGEKAAFKLSSLNIEYNAESLVRAAFSGRLSAAEAFGTVLTLYSGELQRRESTLLSFGKSFFAKAKKYLTNEKEFLGSIHWLADNYVACETKFLATATDANIARGSAKVSAFVFDAWKVDNDIKEPLKAKAAKKAPTGKGKLFSKRF